MTLASSVASTVISNGTILLFYQDPAGNIQLTSRDWNSSLWSPSTLVTRDAKLFTPLATISSDTLSPIRLMYINNQQTLADVECIGQPCSWQNGTLSQKNVVPFQNTSLAVPAYNCTNFDLFYQDTDSSLMVARYQADSSSRWNITEVGYRNFLLGSSLAALDYDTTHQVRVYGQNLKVEATEYMTSDNLAWSTGSFKYQVGPEKPLLAASAINTTSLVSLHVFTIKNGQIEMTFHNGSASWAPLTFNNQQDFNSRIRTMNITAISVVTLNSPQEASNLYFTNTQGQLWELQMNPASGTWEPLNRTVLTDIVQPPPGPTGISGLGIAFITSAVLVSMIVVLVGFIFRKRIIKRFKKEPALPSADLETAAAAPTEVTPVPVQPAVQPAIPPASAASFDQIDTPTSSSDILKDNLGSVSFQPLPDSPPSYFDTTQSRSSTNGNSEQRN